MDASGTAVVTGSSRGIGRAVTEELADRGFEVVATMRDPDAGRELDDHPSGRIRVQRLDVTTPESIELPERMAVLVNNAGIEGDYLPIEHASLRQWRDMFETNVFGLLEITKRAIPRLRANGHGVICNVSSSSLLAPVPFYAAYRASKAAVSALGESLLTELAAFEIRVVEVMPGPIETDMLAASDRMPEAYEFPEYRALAERSLEARKGVAAMTTAASEAAAAIVDAVLDDESPLRVGCDPLSSGMLDAWRAQPDEDWLRSMSEALG